MSYTIDPTPQEIRQRIAEVQATWTDKEREQRRRRALFVGCPRSEALVVPTVREADLGLEPSLNFGG